MRKLFVAAMLMVAPQVAHAADLSGTWNTKDASARVSFEQCGQKVCGKFIWLKDENGGKVLLDEKNENPALRSRKLIGLRFIEFARSGAGWQGNVYNPEDGMTYSAEANLIAANKLEIKGCAGPLCESETWTRAN